MAATGLPTKGATNQTSSLTIVLSTSNSANVFTDDNSADAYLLSNQPTIRTVCQVPLDTGRRTRLV